MPSLGKIEVRKDAPNAPGTSRKHSHASSDGGLRLEFCDPFEFHMGANAWRLRLLDRDVDVSHEHGFLGGDDWRHPDQYQPWRVESPQLVLVSWKPAAFLYDLERQKPTVCNLSGHILAAMASRTLPRVALQGPTTTSLLDVKGKVVAVLPENPGQTERPALAWFDEANCLLVVGRERAVLRQRWLSSKPLPGKQSAAFPWIPRHCFRTQTRTTRRLEGIATP
jgi:hypothetical protein